MGTISQKIEYLNETKQRQKTLINALGGNITNDTPFREYEKELVGVLPKVTGEGTNISLSPTIEYDLEVDSYKGDTTQNTLTGKNLYNVRDYYNATGSGLTTTYNEDGSLTTTGVPTTDYASISRNFEIDDILEDGASYTISSPTYVTYVYIQVQVKNKNTSTSTYLSATTSAKTFVVDKSTYTYILRIQSSTRANWGTSSRTITNYYQLEKGNQATSYEPYCGGIPSPNPNYPQDIQVVTGTQTVTISNSDNTESQTYTLHLGDLELAKIGAAQDYIYYNNGKWYKESAIKKLILNGSENSWATGQGQGSVIRYEYSISGLITTTENANVGEIYSNYFTRKSANQTYIGGIGVSFKNKGSSGLYFYDGTNNPLTSFKAWLETHNTIVYAPLQTPTTTEITDTTLLSDLNNIKENAKSYSGTTNISSSGNLPVIISASAIKQLS